jgi:hypothetical protein
MLNQQKVRRVTTTGGFRDLVLQIGWGSQIRTEFVLTNFPGDSEAAYLTAQSWLELGRPATARRMFIKLGAMSPRFSVTR